MRILFKTLSRIIASLDNIYLGSDIFQDCPAHGKNFDKQFVKITPVGHECIVGIMIQVLSLMATHSDERSQCSESTTKNYRLDSK